MESEFGKKIDDGIILRSSTEFLTLSAVASSFLPPGDGVGISSSEALYERGQCATECSRWLQSMLLISSDTNVKGNLIQAGRQQVLMLERQRVVAHRYWKVGIVLRSSNMTQLSAHTLVRM
jgi:hypothetical protein